VRVSCMQENLARGLSIVGRAVSPRSTLPVLGNILLSTEDHGLMLAATNLEIGIKCWIGAKVEDEGAITVPARLLSEFVNQLPPEPIDMELTVRTLTLNLKCARYDTNIKGIDASEFPIIPTLGDEHQATVSLEAATLRKMITQVVFAAATDESRPTLTGVDFRIGQDRLTLAATDGFRLAVRSTTLDAPAGQKSEVIVPARALAELSRIIGLLPDVDDKPVEIAVADDRNQIMFRLPGVDMVSQLIDANFPNYEAIIPAKHTTRTIVDTAELLQALRVANLFARDSSNIVRFQVTPGQDGQDGKNATLTLTATSAESGDNLAALDAMIEGTEAEIAFNARYMIDVLSVIDELQVALETTRPSAPGVIRPVGVGPEEFTSVVMPMHINP